MDGNAAIDTEHVVIIIRVYTSLALVSSDEAILQWETHLQHLHTDVLQRARLHAHDAQKCSLVSV